MRIARLGLARYGHFDDHEIDFGPRSGGVDLHVVYGDNEAGKSTSLNAVLDLLFGIHRNKPRYAFRHERKALRIEALLQRDDDELDIVRTGKGLSDAQGTALADAALAPWLQGLDRQSYEAMFSMDEETLEQGGKDILASRGDLGSLLFSAGSGLGDVEGRLARLLDEQAGYYVPGKRTGLPLFEDLERLKSIDRELKSLDTRADQWRKLHGELDAARAAFADADEAVRRNGPRLKRLEASERWRLTAIGLLERLAELGPDDTTAAVPDAWWTELDAFMKRARSVDRQRAELQARRDRLARELSAGSTDAQVSDDGNVCEPGSSERATPTDDPTRLAATAALERLGIDGPLQAFDDPLLLGERSQRCRELLVAHGALLVAQRTTAFEQDRTLEAYEAIPADAGDDNDAEERAQAIDRTLETIVADPSCAPLNELLASRHDLLDKQAEAMAELTPWRGELSALVALSPPDPDELASIDSTLEKAERAQVVARQARDRLLQQRARNSLDDAPADTIDDASFQAAVHAHWTRWRTHREALATDADPAMRNATADAFETALRETERLAAVRDVRLESLIELRERARSARRLDEEIAGADAILTEADATVASIAKQRDALAERCAHPPGSEVARLLQWVDRRRRVLALERERQALDRRIGEREQNRARAASRLAGMLNDPTRQPTAIEAPLEEHLSAARAFVAILQDRHERHCQRMADRAALEEQLAERRTQSDRARTALSQWQNDWAAATRGSLLQSAAVETAANTLAELEIIAEARRQQQRSHRELSDVTQALADLEVRERQTVQAVIERTEALKVRTLDELHDALSGIRTRRTLRDDIERERGRLLAEAAIDADEPVTLDALASQDSHVLAASIEQTQRDCEDSHARRDACLTAVNGAKAALAAIGADNAVARLEEERAALLLAIGESAREALSLRIGVAAAREGIRRWRHSQRSEMLDDASRTFVALTDRHFTSLVAEADGTGGDRLLAMAADGSSKSTTDLSKGTRFQLYLALRIAAYRHVCGHRAPPPFIADDVLETFDDERTALTFQAFHEMSRSGQLIYLTHHRHVVDIARQVTNGAVQVHELPRRSNLSSNTGV